MQPLLYRLLPWCLVIYGGITTITRQQYPKMSAHDGYLLRYMVRKNKYRSTVAIKVIT